MASNSYKGITIKFGADPSELSKALREIDKEAKSTSADIKEIEKGLKIDPKNVDLTVQKISKLSEGVQLASKKLEKLKAAQAEAAEAMAKGAEGAEEQYKGLDKEIQRTEKQLTRLKQQAKDTGDAMKKDMLGPIEDLKGKLDDLGKKSLAAATAAVGAGLIAVTKSAVDSFAEYEQLTGGVETLFKGSSDRVLKYAENAYKTAGLSANEYLATVTSFSASLLQGLDGDTEKAAKLSDQAITDMADNANKMGTSIESIQNAYQGFAKQNYTMLDNLKLGYGGTQAEMARLINDSGVLGNKITVTAETVNSVSFDKMIEAIHVVQTELGITGTTAEEAEKTISGSLSAVKAAWSNLMTGLGDETADTDKLTKNFTDALETFIDNVKPVLKQTLKSIGSVLEEVLPEGLISGLEMLAGLLENVGRVFANHAGEVIAAVAAYKAFKTAIAMKDAITGAVAALRGLKTATDAAKTSQDAANASAAANPYAAIAAGAAFAITKIMDFVAAQYEANAAYGEFFDEVEKELEKNSEAVRSYDQLRESIEANQRAREKSIADVEGEYYGYEKLAARLYELNEIQDKSAGNEAEMLEIISKLEGGVDGLSIAYDKETKSLITQRNEIEKAIEAQKELALAKAAAKNQEEIASDIASVELDKNKLSREIEEVYKEKKNLVEEAAKKYGIEADGAYESVNALRLLRQNTSSNYDVQKREELDATIKKIEELEAKESQLTVRYNDAQNKYEELNKEYDIGTEMIKGYTEVLKEDSVAAEDASDAVDKLSGAYGNAKNKVSSYRSELVSLISTLDKVNSGTKYSTTQILDLLSQYPELANSVHLTSEGYEVEAAAIQKLIDKKADLMLTEAREAEESARKAAFKASENYNSAIRSGLANGENLGELGRQVREAQEAWRQAESTVKALEKVTADIKNDNLVQGAAESASKTKEDKTDYWKQAAEAEIAEVEHLYKMGEISAEEYYNRLTDINRRYYANRAQYLEEYRKLEETVYSGMKKQQEEQLSNMKSLLDRIEAVKNAQRELENAQNQKVTVYSSAAGFRTEQNASAIEKASTTLQSKQLELASVLQSKYGMDVNVPQIGAAELTSLLPNLSGIRIPTATASQTKEITVNYTAGDVYINGSADSGTVDRLKALMNSESKRFFEEYLSDYLSRADMDRQTGG